MNFLFLVFVVLNVFASEEASFEFSGQSIEHVSREFRVINDISEPWSNASRTSANRIEREDGIVSFVNPEFKTSLSFKFKVPKEEYSSTIVPDSVPEGVLIGVQKAGLSPKNEKQFKVKFFSLNDLKKSPVKEILEAQYEVKSGKTKILIKGNLDLDREVTIVRVAKVRRGFLKQETYENKFTGSLKDLSAKVSQNADGTSSVSWTKSFAPEALSQSITLIVSPEFPESFKLHGDKSKVLMPVSSSVKLIK